MSQAQNIIREIETSSKTSDVSALSSMTTDGIVLESRERESNPSQLFTHNGENKDNYAVSSRMQTKIYAVFAAELWHQKPDAVWAGAETHNRRLLVHKLPNPDLLSLVVSDTESMWTTMNSYAESLVESISKDI